MPDTKVVLPSIQNFLALPVGTAIGRYRISGILGQGSFGITYRAHDGQLGRDVAIKEYLPTTFAVRHSGLGVVPNSTGAMEDFAWGRERFVEEGRTLAGFQRAPGIVRVYDFLEANGTAYIVMELVRGETLGARLGRQGPLPPPQVERILRTLLDGLEEVHSASFIHRDIKPDNILLDNQGEPTLIDFGAARAAVVGRTVPLTGIFTPGYAAVEQFTDARQGVFTDIYGLSATLYQSITGEKPPTAFDRMLEDKYVPLAKRQPAGFGAALLAGIDRGMSIRPEARPQSIAAWREVLFPKETRPKLTAEQEPPQKPPRWRTVAIAGLAATLVAGAAGGALLLLSLPTAPAADQQQAEEETQRQAAAVAAAETRRAEEEAQRQAAAAAAAETRRAEEEAQRQAAAAAAAETRRAEEEAQRQAAAAAAAETRRAEEEAQHQAAAAAAAETRRAEEEAQRRKTPSSDPDHPASPRESSAVHQPPEGRMSRSQPSLRRTGPRPLPNYGQPMPLVSLTAANLTHGASRLWQITVTMTSNTTRAVDTQVQCNFLNGGRSVLSANLGPVVIAAGEQISTELIGPETTVFVDSATCRVMIP